MKRSNTKNVALQTPSKPSKTKTERSQDGASHARLISPSLMEVRKLAEKEIGPMWNEALLVDKARRTRQLPCERLTTIRLRQCQKESSEEKRLSILASERQSSEPENPESSSTPTTQKNLQELQRLMELYDRRKPTKPVSSKKKPSTA